MLGLSALSNRLHPLPLHGFYQASKSLYLPTQTEKHFSTKFFIKVTQHQQAWELPLATLNPDIQYVSQDDRVNCNLNKRIALLSL